MKAKLEIVARPTEHRAKTTGEASAALRRERYKDELSNDFGISGSSIRDRLPSPANPIRIGALVMLLLVVIVTFMATIAFLLWRDGRLHIGWPERSAKSTPRTPTTNWVLGHNAPRASETVVAVEEPTTEMPEAPPVSEEADDEPAIATTSNAS